MFINTYLLLKKNSFFGDFVLNFTKLDTSNCLEISTNKFKSFLIITFELVLPIVFEIIKSLYHCIDDADKPNIVLINYI